jgi:hypothetical protein
MSMSVKVIKKRIRGLVWTGSLSYRRMHITYEARKMLCPYCSCELEPVRYFGSKVFQKDPMKNDYKGNFWSEYKENDEVVWFSAPDLERNRFDR